MNILGKVLDESDSPVEFATVYVSDSKGSPVQPNRNATTDEKGNYKLDNVTETDHITARQVGLMPTTRLANKVVKMSAVNPFGGLITIPTLNFKLKQDPLNTLSTVEITAKKPKSNVLKYGLIASSLLLLVAGVSYAVKKKLIF